MRKVYDYIVADSVPAGMVADCMIANRVADMTLFVVRASKTLKRTLPEAEQLYKNGRLRHMAVLLNCVDSD
jgi:phage terminase large subunit-like protein